MDLSVDLAVVEAVLATEAVALEEGWEGLLVEEPTAVANEVCTSKPVCIEPLLMHN